jgi:ribosomal 30S subunit maturation factor RimM
MMGQQIRLLDVVDLVDDLPDHGSERGEVGTVVEFLAPDVLEVEFSDNGGQPYAMLPLRTDQFPVLAIRLATEA